ncbi:MAG: glycosyltransferase family 4 protein [Glaciimonas sp.]|nr:glycosyltransferase family 4 protein [Glaciimonas sp.]
MRIAVIGTVASSILGFRNDMIQAMLARGDEVYAFAMDYDEDSKAKVRQLGAIPVEYEFSRSGMNPLADLANTLRLAGLLKVINPNLVFSYFSKPVIFGTLAAVLAGVKCRVAMLEGLGYVFTDQPGGISWKTKALRSVQIFLYRIAFRFLDRLIFLNPDDPLDLVQRYKLKVKKVSVLGGIGLNFDLYPFTVAPVEPVSFLFMGRLLAEKGINDFIAAAKIVKERYPTVRFIALGSIDESNPGSVKIDQLEGYVRSGLLVHPGHVNNVVEWIGSTSVFVLPSYYREGVPRSTQEAMAIGRPIITTDAPGCRETVVEGVNGFMVPPWSPIRLAEKMFYFIENPYKIIVMGLASHHLARKKFDSTQVNARLLNMLDDA